MLRCGAFRIPVMCIYHFLYMPVGPSRMTGSILPPLPCQGKTVKQIAVSLSNPYRNKLAGRSLRSSATSTHHAPSS